MAINEKNASWLKRHYIILTFSSFLKESLPRFGGEYPANGGGRWLNF
jgi:hypothetical protein